MVRGFNSIAFFLRIPTPALSGTSNVAPEYGTMADWDALVREANKRGIRILVDLVLNHSSDQHPWFKESRSSIDNPKRDWYIWRNGAAAGEPPTHWESIFGGYAWTLDPATQQWYYHIFLPQQPDLNWASPGLRQAMFEVVRFWLDHGAGGAIEHGGERHRDVVAAFAGGDERAPG